MLHQSCLHGITIWFPAPINSCGLTSADGQGMGDSTPKSLMWKSVKPIGKAIPVIVILPVMVGFFLIALMYRCPWAHSDLQHSVLSCYMSMYHWCSPRVCLQGTRDTKGNLSLEQLFHRWKYHVLLGTWVEVLAFVLKSMGSPLCGLTLALVSGCLYRRRRHGRWVGWHC